MEIRAIRARLEKLRDPLKTIVCWFHTHPGHGIFLSDDDQFINRHFFKEDGQLAIVFDPTKGRNGALGVFSAQGAAESREAEGRSVQFGNFRLHRGFYVYKSHRVVEEAETAEASIRITPEDIVDTEIKVGETYDVIDWKKIYGSGLWGHVQRARDKIKGKIKK